LQIDGPANGALVNLSNQNLSFTSKITIFI